MPEEKIKELAREYIDNCTKRAGFVILTENIKNDFIDLFVAGFMKCLELNKEIKWHKVADGDLPKEKKEYWCKAFYYKSKETFNAFLWFNPDTKAFNPLEEIEDTSGSYNVKAWCEIPEYTEE